MITFKIYLDKPENAQDFFPREYLPGDVIVYQFDPDWFDVYHFLNIVMSDILDRCEKECEVKNERKKKGKNKKR